MTTPYEWEAESSVIEKYLDHFNQLEIVEYVEDNPVDLNKYGLKNPSATISVTDDKSTQYLYLGKNVDGNFYLKNGKNDSVYLVSTAGFEFLDNETTAFLQQFVSLAINHQLIDFISS